MSESNNYTTVNTNLGPGCLVRLLYFILIGVWLGAIWIILAWILNITIIGLPLGLAMINSLPQVMTLRPARRREVIEVRNGVPVLRTESLPQHNFFIRALYFILIGWWLSLIWMILAWVLAGITLGLGLPIAFWMFDQVPALTTLARI
jgi:uncharacterized membrane protein YccF (DUF307 family)